MKKKPEQKTKKNRLKTALTILIVTPLFIAIAGICAAAIVLNTGEEKLDPSKLQASVTDLKITDKTGSHVDIPEKYDDYALSEEIPDKLKNAFVALEDKRFYRHHGLDYLRIGKAALKNIGVGEFAEGASTISQQLIKNTHLNAEKSLKRKLSEARLALKLEKEYTKDEILTMYLNMLYFGSGEYGVKNAARRFFGKDLRSLNIAECAMLAGIVKSPTKYNPINNYADSIKRKDLVLAVMLKENVIDENEYKAALATEIIIKNEVNENNLANNFLIYSIEECCEILNMRNEALLKSGYTIKTYLDMRAQKRLEATLNNPALTLTDISGNAPSCAAIVLDNASCGISAFYSSGAYSPHTKRSPGSLLKPLVCYAPAMECGVLCPASLLLDEPKDFFGYCPRNYKDEYYGIVSVRECLARSLNIPAVDAMRMVGVEKACSYLSAMGIEIVDSDLNYATALGGMTHGVNITELAGAYAILASGGEYSVPRFVAEITDAEGKVLYRHDPAKRRVFGADTAYLITDILRDTAKYGTAKKLSPLKIDIASKTGTVSAGDENFNTDVYNASYTAAQTAVFWQGDLSGDGSGLLPASITGGGSPTLFAREYFAGDNSASFVCPAGVVRLKTDKIAASESGTLMLADEKAPFFSVSEELFSTRWLPEKNNSYSELPRPEYVIERSSDGTLIEITADPHLNYRLIKKDYFGGDSVLADFSGRRKQFSVTVPPSIDDAFAPRYAIEVYYSDGSRRHVKSYALRLY